MNKLTPTFSILLSAGAFIFWASCPNFGRRKNCLPFAEWPYAHRGLWDMNKKIPENSLPAFARAVENRYAIELDVHLTKDGQLVVFHDDTLKRMCGPDRQIEHMTYEEICQYPLLDTEYHAPLLSQVLSVVDGKVPLLIEMKLPGRSLSLCPVLADLLADYAGPYLIESFQPMGLYWFRKNRPDVLRGQLSSRYKPSEPPVLPLKIASTHLLLNWISRPDFIAYNHEHFGSFGSLLHRKIFRTPFWVWTIRSEKDYKTCLPAFDGIIFERFIPNNKEKR